MGSFCKYCGAQIAPGSKFCKACGKPASDRIDPAPRVNPAQSTVPVQPINVTLTQETLTEETLPDKFKPVGMWQYFWLDILYSIPVVGFIFLLIHAIGGGGNVNRKYFARSKFCVLILVLILAAIGVAIYLAFKYVGTASGVTDMLTYVD